MQQDCPTHSAQEVAVARQEDFFARLDTRLRQRNEDLTRKILAWGELLDIAGWCVALDQSDGGIWVSRNAERDLRQRCGGVPDGWSDLVGKIPLSSQHHGSESVLIWAGQSPTAAAKVLDPLLTQREDEVMTWLREGKTSPEIAIILGCAVRTVEKHIANLYRKIGVKNRAAIILNSFKSED